MTSSVRYDGFRAELDAWYQSRNLRVECEEDRTAPLVHRLESTADGSSARIGEGILDDSTNGAWTEAGSLATASTTSPRASRWPFIWLMIGAGAVIAAATAVVLLERADYFWRNPLADAQFRPVTDFGGTEQAAAISRDGKFIAFLSNRDGPVDVWVTQVGTGQFHNLTHGSVRELINPSIRTLSFSPDAALVSL